jgi:dTDP-4-dehydrorhamnose reductase
VNDGSRVLITGSGGQLGRALVASAPKGVRILALSREECDISDFVAVGDAFQTFKPTAVINAAAYTAVDRAETEKERAFAVNAVGPANLARAAESHGVRLVHISTDYVFDGSQSQPYPTDAAPCPINVYGSSKAAGEISITESGADALIVRSAWLYSSTGKNFLTTILGRLQSGGALRVVADQVGTPTSVSQLAKVLWWCVSSAGINGIRHWTNAGMASWYDFAVSIQDIALASGLVRKRVPIVPIPAHEYPTPARRPAYSVLDSTALWNEHGVADHWRSALSETMEEFLPASG